MGKPYSEELDRLPASYRWAGAQDVKQFRHLLARWSGDFATIVGSGGSYSAATVVARYREIAHGSPTTASTPLALQPLIEWTSPRVLLLTAEGKNRDILAAAKAAQACDLQTAALTLTASNPLLDFANATGALRAFAFEADWTKDGYLATNSLIATVLLSYRALFPEEDFATNLAPIFLPNALQKRRTLLNSLPSLELVRQRGLLVVYGTSTAAFAVDLESRLAEGAIAMTQVADLRQFAHGRHLQLARAPAPCVLFACSEADSGLSNATRRLIPSGVPCWPLIVAGTSDQDIAVAALLDAILLTEAIANRLGIDPGQPDVPDFGRAIHSLDVDSYASSPSMVPNRQFLAARRKCATALSRVAAPNESNARALAEQYVHRLSEAHLHAVVCDFDGTLCRAENRFDHMATEHVELISSLIRQGLQFAIATGRGESLWLQLRQVFAPDLHPLIVVGYYSGSLIQRLDESFASTEPNPAFSDLWTWLRSTPFAPRIGKLEQHARGGQFGLRVAESGQSQRLGLAVSQWIISTQRTGWRVFSSGHSVDILDANTSKLNVVAHVASTLSLDPKTEILRIGDAGQEGGNDYELLSEGLGLSCDRVSLDFGRCWNFGHAGATQTEVSMQYLRGLRREQGHFRLQPDALLDSDSLPPQ